MIFKSREEAWTWAVWFPIALIGVPIYAWWVCKNLFGGRFPDEWEAIIALIFLTIFSLIHFLIGVGILCITWAGVMDYVSRKKESREAEFFDH